MAWPRSIATRAPRPGAEDCDEGEEFSRSLRRSGGSCRLEAVDPATPARSWGWRQTPRRAAEQRLGDTTPAGLGAARDSQLDGCGAGRRRRGAEAGSATQQPENTWTAQMGPGHQGRCQSPTKVLPPAAAPTEESRLETAIPQERYLRGPTDLDLILQACLACLPILTIPIRHASPSWRGLPDVNVEPLAETCVVAAVSTAIAERGACGIKKAGRRERFRIPNRGTLAMSRAGG